MSKDSKEIKQILIFLKKENYSVYDIEVKKQEQINHIAIYLNKTNNLDEIINITRKLNHYLDKKDIQDEEYMLEISSKGLIRKLTTLNQYQNSINDLVEFEVDHLKIQGIIKEVPSDKVIIIQTDIQLKEIEISKIKKCKTILVKKEKNER